MKRPLKLLTVLILLIGVASAALADEKWKIQNNASLLLEFDSNVYKSFDDPESDFLGRLFYNFQFHVNPNKNHQISANYQLGAKKFIKIEEQDTLINLLRFGYNYYGIPHSILGASVQGKLRNLKNGEEDYSKLDGLTYFQRWFSHGLRLRVNAETSWFDYRKFNYFDYWLQRYGFDVSKTFESPFTIGLRYQFENKMFPINAFSNIGSRHNVLLKESSRRRVDNLHEMSLDFEWTRWLLARLTYSFQINSSNSYSHSYYNHKLILTLSKSIINPLSIHLLGIFQYRDSFDPTLIPTTLQIEESDENLNQLTLKLSYRAIEWLTIDAKYSRFWNLLTDQSDNFEKNLISVGVGFQF